MRISIIEKENDICEEVSSIIQKYSDDYGFSYDEEKPDIVFYVGGDGTLLRAVNKYIYRLNQIIFIGINEASLGFFYDFSRQDIPMIFEKIANEELNITSHRLIKGCINDENFYAVNEMRLENPFFTFISDIYVNGEMLETFRGSGLLISSTLGSSAYNKSCFGALVDHKIDTIQLTEISSIQNNIYHSLHNSLVLSANNKIVLKGNFKDVVLGYDHLFKKIEFASEARFELSDKYLSLAHKENHSFVAMIKKSFIDK